MGPGFNCEIEKELFSEHFPEVEFWSQPPCESMEELTGRSTEQVARLFETSGEAITLICHSFGGAIAKQILQARPELVKDLVLINSAFDPFECFINLAPHAGVALPSNIRTASIEEKINFIIALASAPNLNELYWFSKEKMEAFAPVFAKHPQLNIDTFLKVFPDFLAQTQDFKISKWNGNVSIFFSEQDRLLNRVKDIEPWLDVFPQAKLHAFANCGHYLHFDSTTAARAIFE